jgi:lactoylglutathione lyase
MRRVATFLLLLSATAFVANMQAADKVKRPRVLGAAHMAVHVSDLQKARAFYKDFLGFEEPYTTKRSDGSEQIALIKINEDQYLELVAEAPKKDGHLNHFSILTDSAESMRLYLASKGVKVPEKVGIDQVGNTNFNVTDPDGHTLEFVEHSPESSLRRDAGKYLPDTRISTHMMHFGFSVRDLEPSMKFYGDTLGFSETWRGSSSGKSLSWVNLRVPDGTDYVELMLHERPPDMNQLGSMNHVCLVVSDVAKVVATLQMRAAKSGYARPMEIRTGVNGKRRINVFDPDGTRVEIMEPDTIDGKPVPSSLAPAPKFDPNAPVEPKSKNSDINKTGQPAK